MKRTAMIECREQAATTGPWKSGVQHLKAGVNDGSNTWWTPINIEEGKCAYCDNFRLIGTVCENGANYHVHGNIGSHEVITSEVVLRTVIPEESGLSEEDSEFIRHSREDIPFLLQRSRRFEAVIAQSLHTLEANQTNPESVTQVMEWLRQVIEQADWEDMQEPLCTLVKCSQKRVGSNL